MRHDQAVIKKVLLNDEPIFDLEQAFTEGRFKIKRETDGVDIRTQDAIDAFQRDSDKSSGVPVRIGAKPNAGKIFRRRCRSVNAVMKRTAPHVIRIDRSLKVSRDAVFEGRSTLDQIELAARFLSPPGKPLLDFLAALR